MAFDRSERALPKMAEPLVFARAASIVVPGMDGGHPSSMAKTSASEAKNALRSPSSGSQYSSGAFSVLRSIP